MYGNKGFGIKEKKNIHICYKWYNVARK